MAAQQIFAVGADRMPQVHCAIVWLIHVIASFERCNGGINN